MESKVDEIKAACQAYDQAEDTGDLSHMLWLSFGLPMPLVPPPAAAAGTASSPPATPLRFVGRASLMTMADSISTMTQSQLESQSQPPESQPATTPAGPSLTRCSTGRSTTSATLESDSEDGSDLDENDDAWEDDVEEEQVDEDNDDCENDDNDNGSVHVPLLLAEPPRSFQQSCPAKLDGTSCLNSITGRHWGTIRAQ
jgi:hypothetical protein